MAATSAAAKAIVAAVNAGGAVVAVAAVVVVVASEDTLGDVLLPKPGNVLGNGAGTRAAAADGLRHALTGHRSSRLQIYSPKQRDEPTWPSRSLWCVVAATGFDSTITPAASVDASENDVETFVDGWGVLPNGAAKVGSMHL